MHLVQLFVNQSSLFSSSSLRIFLFFAQFVSYVLFKYTYFNNKCYHITGETIPSRQTYPFFVFLSPLAFDFCVLVIPYFRLCSFIHVFSSVSKSLLFLLTIYFRLSLSRQRQGQLNILPAFSNVKSDITYAQSKLRSLFSSILTPFSRLFFFYILFTIKSFLICGLF